MQGFTIGTPLLVICFCCLDSRIINDPIPDITSCSGRNITIGWEYDNQSNLFFALWRFSNGSLTNEPILQKIRTGQPTKPQNSSIEVEFIENGTITLTNTGASYTGNYTLDLTYSRIHPASDTDTVSIIFNDPPQVLTYQLTSLNAVNCSGSPDIPTILRVSKHGLQTRLEKSPYTSNDTNEGIECCYNGHAANCSSQTFNAIYNDLYCLTVRVEIAELTELSEKMLKTWIIVLILITSIMLVIGVIGGGICYYKRTGIEDHDNASDAVQVQMIRRTKGQIDDSTSVKQQITPIFPESTDNRNIEEQ